MLFKFKVRKFFCLSLIYCSEFMIALDWIITLVLGLGTTRSIDSTLRERFVRVGFVLESFVFLNLEEDRQQLSKYIIYIKYK